MTTTAQRFEQAVREMAAEMTAMEIKAEVDAIYKRITTEAAAKVYGTTKA